MCPGNFTVSLCRTLSAVAGNDRNFYRPSVLCPVRPSEIFGLFCSFTWEGTSQVLPYVETFVYLESGPSGYSPKTEWLDILLRTYNRFGDLNVINQYRRWPLILSLNVDEPSSFPETIISARFVVLPQGEIFYFTCEWKNIQKRSKTKGPRRRGKSRRLL